MRDGGKKTIELMKKLISGVKKFFLLLISKIKLESLEDF